MQYISLLWSRDRSIGQSFVTKFAIIHPAVIPYFGFAYTQECSCRISTFGPDASDVQFNIPLPIARSTAEVLRLYKFSFVVDQKCHLVLHTEYIADKPTR